MPDTTYVLTEQNNIISKIDSEFLSTMLPDVVHYTEDIGKTDAEKLQARTNIDSEAKILVVTITGSSGVYFADKSYTAVDKAYKAGKIVLFIFGDSTAIVTSYENDGGIGTYKAVTVVKSDNSYKYCAIYYVQGLGVSISFSNLSNDTNAVHYTADSNKTDAEKLQARTNIGAGTADLFVINFSISHGVYSADKTFAEIAAAIEAGKICEVHFGNLIAQMFYNNGTDFIRFVNLQEDSTNNVLHVNEIQVGDDDTWDVSDYTYSRAPTIISDLSSTSISVSLRNYYNGVECKYGELTSLTVSSVSGTDEIIIKFTSGSTPTTTNFPASMVFPEAFAAEANTRYEINVSDGYALVASWPVS